MFRSRDGGASWTWAGAGLPGYTLRALAVDPDHPERAWAATDVGVYRSLNAGKSWQRTELQQPMLGIVRAASDPERLYALGSKVWISRDAGDSWQPAAGLPEFAIRTLAVSSREPDTAYALSRTALFRSADGGLSWQAVSGAAPPPEALSLAVDPREPATLYAGTARAGIWKSRDRGAIWSQALDLGAAWVVALAIDPAASQRIFAGVIRFGRVRTGEGWRSVDQGYTWRQVVSSPPVDALVASPDTGELYLGVEQSGVLKSRDRGASWAAARNGLRSLTVHAVAADPHHAGSLLLSVEVSTDGNTRYPGPFKSSDGGKTWLPSIRGLGGAYRPFIAKFVFDPLRPDRVWALGSNGPVKSTDGGASWQPAAQEALGIIASDLAIDPGAPDVVYLAGFRESGCDLPFCDPHTVEPAALRSRDDGESWETLTGSFDRGLHSDLLRALVLHPQRPASLYLGGTAGFFRSRDAGDHWLRLGTGLPDAEVHLLVLVAPSTLYAAVRTASGGSSLWKSADLGASWKPAANGLPAGQALYQLAADPRRPATLYAATEKGAFVTDDAAVSWQPLNAGLQAPVLSLAVDSHNPRQLYAGSLFQGLFALTRADR